jgi:molybdopterin-containing oxidoreductase family iron-sulfur binding subunit
MSRHFQLSKHDFSGAAADKRLQCLLQIKQALVHIYNIVTGSSVAVTLDNSLKQK